MNNTCFISRDSKNEEDDFNKLFPVYDKDFIDITGMDINDNNHHDVIEEPDYSFISHEDVNVVYKFHVKLLNMCVKSEWLNLKVEDLNCNYVSPLIQRYGIFRDVIEKSIDSLPASMDKELLTSLNVVIYVSQKFGDVNIFGK